MARRYRVLSDMDAEIIEIIVTCERAGWIRVTDGGRMELTDAGHEIVREARESDNPSEDARMLAAIGNATIGAEDE